MHLVPEQHVGISPLLSPCEYLFLRLIALPRLDLDHFVRSEGEENPFLEVEPPPIPASRALSDISATRSFRDVLSTQVRFRFDDQSAALAAWVVGILTMQAIFACQSRI